MLKALELVGFKSFADRTRFEFPKGITAVVGPNGSGKSNVVDAIKWVLGEQSVKSLRGKEMADCIFNGSATRAALNMAETTLVFDNGERRLAIDTPEVAITRRVYRNGEGEYLINHQPARLRDIRDLFSGTGVATEAYSVIEQGKVDVLLQSSARDRRMIFEEAAGISRFKAKKLESLRRLERVDQNMLRLSDIVSEVESRLRSLRTQAGKARRYQELADRLQQLRTHVAATDWRELTTRLDALSAELNTLGAEKLHAEQQRVALEAETTQLEAGLAESETEFRLREARLAQNRERIAALEAGMSHQRERLLELALEAERVRENLVAQRTRTGDLQQQIADTRAAAAEAEQRYQLVQLEVARHDDELAQLGTALEAARVENERLRSDHVQALRHAATAASEIGSIESQIAGVEQAIVRHQTRLAEFDAARQQAEEQRLQRQAELRIGAETADARQVEMARAHAQLVELRQQLSAQIADLNQLRQRQSGARERAALLEELESRLEGVTAGVKGVLQAARSADSPLRQVRGMVADLLRVSVEMAPVIDAALGERAQHLVVTDDPSLWEYLEQQVYKFKGRVSFVRLGNDAPPSGSADLSNVPGVVGRADRYVESDGEFAGVARRLLGSTWIVRNLSDARRLAAAAKGTASFVTLAAEFIAADGTVTVGPRQGSSGLLSRRSELRSLKQVLIELDREIESVAEVQSSLEARIAKEDKRIEAISSQRAVAIQELGECRARAQAVQAQIDQLNKQRDAVGAEIAAAGQQRLEMETRLTTQRTECAAADQRALQIEAEFNAAQARMAAIAEQRLECQARATQVHIELTACEERFRSLVDRAGQLERDQNERRLTLDELRRQLDGNRTRHTAGELAILTSESESAELFVAAESLQAEMASLAQARDAARQRRAAVVTQGQSLREQLRRVDEQLHKLQLETSQIGFERQALADRLRDDYGIELATLEHRPSDDELKEREAIDQEIAELRRKLNQLGNVNLEALAELDELEARYTGLKAQYDDLDQARKSLVQIIDKINNDSRQLFVATLEQVRGHFQTLFRKLFGGGQADIVMEEGEDILEGGIEIVARPPGKEPRSISLLSGGEKTLTCVALLLSIFQYRPSPFCVLDEVDAALDEANIERFSRVLQDFMTSTQFIVVTHSKKTMTAASTLYGVTMQESGISKRVSVRFEDISDDGRIRESTGDDETQAA